MYNKHSLENIIDFIGSNYYKKENNRDEAFLKDLFVTIESLYAIGEEYIKTEGNVHPNYVLEKIQFGKDRWDSAHEYFKLKVSQVKGKE